VPQYFHVTKVGLITKNFIGCASAKKKEKIINEIEIKYQQSTIRKFGLCFDGTDFILTNQQIDCLEKNACNIFYKPPKQVFGCCSPKEGCC